MCAAHSGPRVRSRGFRLSGSPERRWPSEGHYADHQLGENGAAPSWQMIMGRGGTNVRFGVSQQATKLAYVRDRNEPIGTPHTTS
jgi:hypothetical protein